MLLFLVTPCLVVAAQTCMEWIPIQLAGDLNAQVAGKSFDTFLYQHELTLKNTYSTCYKNANNHSYIDQILTNSPKSFFKTETVFTGLSDFHKLVLSLSKGCVQKGKNVLFHFKSSFHSQENQILEFLILKFHGVIKCLSIEQEIHFIE